MRAGVSDKSQASPVPASPSSGQGDVGGHVRQGPWWSRSGNSRNQGSCCSHELPFLRCAWSLKGLSLTQAGKGDWTTRGMEQTGRGTSMRIRSETLDRT